MTGKKQPLWLHKAISWGASIVILGALGKILHIGGVYANYVIGIGLLVESILFFLTGFFPPEPEPEWGRVYPELNPDYKGELPTNNRSTPLANSQLGKLDHIINQEISPDLIKNLGDGLRTFGDKVSSISNVASASEATNEFTNKVKTASAGFEQLNSAFDSATKNLQSLADSGDHSKAYQEQVTHLAKNLTALNSVYELELRETSTHMNEMNKFYQNLSLTMKNFNESMDDSQQFKDEVGKLAKNLASLNAIYGNMLSAMNQPRV